jgi:hypothetical protein
MNLSGSHQRFDTDSQGQGDSSIAIAFRSRPVFTTMQRATGRREERTLHRGNWKREGLPSWRASVWDEVYSRSDGTLLRTIKILITDGPQLEPEEAA